MGTDKALLSVGGERLIDRVARRIEPACGKVLVASGRRPLPGLRWRQIPDALPAVGPVGGLLAALARAPSQHVAVVAVDMPSVSPSVLIRLATLVAGADAAVPRVAGRLQPLHAVYRTRALARAERYVSGGGRSLHGLLAGLDLVVDTCYGTADRARFVANVNEPRDLE